MNIKDKLKKIFAIKSKKINVFECDKAVWQYDDAKVAYQNYTGKKSNELTEEDSFKIYEYASNYISFFITWLIDNDFLRQNYSNENEDIRFVQNRKMTGYEYFEKHFDLVLNRDDINPEILGFLDVYYNKKYVDDYCAFMINVIKKDVYTEFSFTDYEKFKHKINERYEEYCKGLIK